MARITIEDYDPKRHPNPMGFRNPQEERHKQSPTLEPYKVCLVTAAGFTFIFHSLEQLKLCLHYYEQKTHPSSRLPAYSECYEGYFSGHPWRYPKRWRYYVERWFERLPQFLLEKGRRGKVSKALHKALEAYSKTPGATTGASLIPYSDPSDTIEMTQRNQERSLKS